MEIGTSGSVGESAAQEGAVLDKQAPEVTAGDRPAGDATRETPRNAAPATPEPASFSGKPAPGKAAPATRRARALSLVAGLLAVLGIFVLFRSMLAMTNLFVTHAGELDPLSRAISYYVFVEHAVETFNATLIAVSVATATILLGMAQLRVRLGVPALSWFAVWCVGLVLCVVFPVDNSPYVETVSGWIHQFAGGSLFISFPLAGYALAKRLGTQPDWARTGRVVRKFAVTTTVIALTYLAMRLPDMLHWWEFPAALDWRALGGLAQRSMFAVALVMLLVLAVQLLRVAWRHRRAAVPAERVGQTP